jgi:hypothetical protein
LPTGVGADGSLEQADGLGVGCRVSVGLAQPALGAKAAIDRFGGGEGEARGLVNVSYPCGAEEVSTGNVTG